MQVEISNKHKFTLRIEPHWLHFTNDNLCLNFRLTVQEISVNVSKFASVKIILFTLFALKEFHFISFTVMFWLFSASQPSQEERLARRQLIEQYSTWGMSKSSRKKKILDFSPIIEANQSLVIAISTNHCTICLGLESMRAPVHIAGTVCLSSSCFCIARWRLRTIYTAQLLSFTVACNLFIRHTLNTSFIVFATKLPKCREVCGMFFFST